MYIQLYQIKQHLNIDESFTEDDEYLVTLETVAEKAVERHIDCSLSEIASANGGELPSPLLQAMKLFIGNMYLQRESVSYSSMVEVPQSYNYLLNLYKDYSKKSDEGGIF